MRLPADGILWPPSMPVALLNIALYREIRTTLAQIAEEVGDH
jgi:hypothetical protein